MPRLLAGLLFALLLLALMAGAAPFTAAQSPGELYLPYVVGSVSEPEPEPDNTFAARVVALVNQERAAAGCQALQVDSRLASAATAHSLDMAVNDFFSHTGSDGSLPWDRMAAAGYVYSTAGENIAAGYTTPEAVVDGWMKSSGHRANILNCAFTETGVGYVFLADDEGQVNYHHYWTHVFAAPG